MRSNKIEISSYEIFEKIFQNEPSISKIDFEKNSVFAVSGEKITIETNDLSLTNKKVLREAKKYNGIIVLTN